MNTTKPTRRGRYTIHDTWTVIDRTPIDHFCDEVGVRTTEVADVTSTPDGPTYEDGAHRVTVKVGTTKRTRTFIGETAWSDADRWAHDTETALLRALDNA